MRIRTILAAAVAPAALAAILLGTAGQASAATAKPVTVTANTHLNNHPDTTNVCGVGLIGSDCVWATDNATEKYTLVQDPSQPNTWQVTMDYVGSFHGFADPNTGAALDSNGSVKGTISYTVTSNSTPDPSLLPGQSAPDAHISTNIKALFGNDPSTVISGGNVYTFTYQNGSYVQLGAPSNITYGDVTGH